MFFVLCVQMCFEWFTKGQHDLESDVQQQLFKEKILKLEPYEITMNGERQYTRFLDYFMNTCVIQQLTWLSYLRFHPV